MRKKIYSMLALLCLTVTSAWAQNPDWLRDGDEWVEATKTLTVKSNTANEAYKGQTVIEHVIISSGVTSVGNSAFQGCSGLTSVTIGNNVTSIGNYAFRSCSSLTSITIPNSVTSIGVTAFGGCTGLTSMVVASENTKYDSRDDCNAIIETSSHTLIAGCQNTIIPGSVTSIGEASFYECIDLTSITIPNSVTSIGDYAFQSCSGLTSITIPSSVTSIGADAFYFCTNITDVYCYADPNNLTWNDGWCDDFKHDDHATVCHVMASALATYEENWGGTSFDDENSTGVNVTFVGDLTYDVTANLANGAYWSTFYSNAGNYQAPDGTQVFAVNLNTSTAEITMTEISDGIVKSGEGVVLKQETTSSDAATTITMTLTATAATDSYFSDNSLQGTMTEINTTGANNYYVLNKKSAGIGFYKLSNTSGTIGANKAYLTYSAGAREFFLFDEATGIEMPTVEDNADAVVYDLQGRRVQNPTKGLYIVNGKKVFINK